MNTPVSKITNYEKPLYEKPLFEEHQGKFFTQKIWDKFNETKKSCMQCSGCHGCR